MQRNSKIFQNNFKTGAKASSDARVVTLSVQRGRRALPRDGNNTESSSSKFNLRVAFLSRIITDLFSKVVK